MEKILILGTGQAQIDVIRCCKEQGMEVYACSYISGDAGEKYVDHFEQINIVDVEAVRAYAAASKVDYIYSVGSDVAMPTVCAVAEQLGLRHFVSSETAHLCNTKHELREALGADFEGNLRYKQISSIDDQPLDCFPLMMKPVDSQGQRGVYLVHNEAELRERFEQSMSFSRQKRLIIEEYVEGDEVSVNTFSVGGKVVFSLISDRESWPQISGGIIHRHFIPSRYADDAQTVARVRSLVERVLERLAICDGPGYFQIIIDRDRIPHLIEVTPRLDGCHMWRLIRFATGVDLMELSVNALRGKATPAIPDYSVRACETEFLCSPPGLTFDRAKYDVSDAQFVHWYYETGDTVRAMNGYMEKGGYAIRAR